MQLPEDKKQKILDKSLGAVMHWLERFDTVIIGPGLGRDEMVHHVVIEVQLLLVLERNCCLLHLDGSLTPDKLFLKSNMAISTSWRPPP